MSPSDPCGATRSASPSSVTPADSASGRLLPRYAAILVATSVASPRSPPWAGTDSFSTSDRFSEPFPLISGGTLSILQRNPAKQPPRAARVCLDLRAEGVHVRKRPLVAHPLDERQPDAGIVQVLVDIEDVRLDRHGIDVAEGRPHADIRNRGMNDAANGRSRGINAGRRNQLVPGLEIGRW